MITVLSPDCSPRLRYAVDFVFARIPDIRYRLLAPHDAEKASLELSDFIIAYGCALPKGVRGMRVHAEGLCAESDFRTELPEVVSREGLPLLFPAPEGSDFPCDIFSSVFFVLSRYEEYLIPTRDLHGRFCAVDTLFHEFLDIPYLDRWVRRFRDSLCGAGAELPKAGPTKTLWQNTIDVDIAYAFRGRGTIRTWGAMGRDVLKSRWQRLKLRRAVLSGRASDPFDTYDWVQRNAGSADSHRYFFLCGGPGEYDINLDPAHPQMKSLVQQVGRYAQVGLHPSYRSLKEPERIATEKQTLEALRGTAITSSRQHFLRMKLPDTYRHLQNAGIREDFSMGFHDRIGFRSGTAWHHPFYDLETEAPTLVEIHPLHAMDSAMKQYMKLDVDTAAAALCSLYNSLATTGGTFSTVWHNHSLSGMWDWEGWRQLYLGFADFVAERA